MLGGFSILSFFLLGEEGIARSIIFSLLELGYLSDSWVSPGRPSRAVRIVVVVEVRMDGCMGEILGQSLIPYIVFTFQVALLCFALVCWVLAINLSQVNELTGSTTNAPSFVRSRLCSVDK